MTWREEGEGPPVVLLHGVPTSGALFRGVRLPGHRMLVPDLPGYGSEPIEDVSVQGHVRWLHDWMDGLGVSRAAFVGVDYGGLLSLATDRATSRVLTSTAASWGWATSVVAALPPFHRLFYELFSGHLYLRRAENPGPLVALHAGRIASDPDFAARMRRTALALRAVTPPRVPTRLVWGSDDPLFPPWMARRLAARLDAELVVVEGGRHTLPWDRPERYAQEVLEHLGA